MKEKNIPENKNILITQRQQSSQSQCKNRNNPSPENYVDINVHFKR